MHTLIISVITVAIITYASSLDLKKKTFCFVLRVHVSEITVNICTYDYSDTCTVNGVCLQEKDSLFEEFLAFKPSGRSAKTVTSTDGVLTVPATPTIATKPARRKRSRAVRGRRRL